MSRFPDHAGKAALCLYWLQAFGTRRHSRPPIFLGLWMVFVVRPLLAHASYGKLSWKGTSLVFTPSPSVLYGKPLNCPPAKTPATARSAMSTTSSETRRPFG